MIANPDNQKFVVNRACPKLAMLVLLSVLQGAMSRYASRSGSANTMNQPAIPAWFDGGRGRRLRPTACERAEDPASLRGKSVRQRPAGRLSKSTLRTVRKPDQDLTPELRIFLNEKLRNELADGFREFDFAFCHQF